ncbi:SufD family Fe-S cluster assembly protein [bacterium]|nr:SufD family Fe-S cluster assembly protein [bacterium]
MKTLSLKHMLQDQMVDGQLPLQVAVTITALPGEQIAIIDDLLDCAPEASAVKHAVTIAAQENSTVTYQLRAVEDCRQTAVEKNITISLVGAGANVDVRAACLTRDSQHIKFNTLQDHVVGDSTSNVLIKAICDDTSRLSCNSMIRIHKGAQGSNAEQANKNILLSKKARAVSIPQLEIEANDVRCKHGAAVSTINDDHLFYLQSRGLSVPQAQAMLIEGFLQ